jgi:hypothetical protein
MHEAQEGHSMEEAPLNGGLGGEPVRHGVANVLQSQMGTDRTPVGEPGWRCPTCDSAEVLVRWEAFGSQVGVLGADGRFQATEDADVYECEPGPSMGMTCAICGEEV